eukprot:TRINITY_DN5418_c5_g1_i1.p1 TRINITY_DN5418_c5_g1~~TRINITY_DN5418_c5_g1_i1.p1  ORF type:complete len:473 (+),score=150.85 TRINITY_DN5418_c5_g1_i1:78-1496(+)
MANPAAVGRLRSTELQKASPPPPPTGFPYSFKSLGKELVAGAGLFAAWECFADSVPMSIILGVACVLQADSILRSALLWVCSYGAGRTPAEWAAKGAECAPLMLKLLFVLFPGTDGGRSSKQEGTFVGASRSGVAGVRLCGWERVLYRCSMLGLALRWSLEALCSSGGAWISALQSLADCCWFPCLMLRIVLPLQHVAANVVADILVGVAMSACGQDRESTLPSLITTLHLATRVVNVVLWSAVVVACTASSGFAWHYVQGTLAATGVLGSVSVAMVLQPLARDFSTACTFVATRGFELGDLVTVSGVSGRVEAIHFRNTHLRLADGGLVIIPNSDIANSLTINCDAASQRTFTLSFKLHEQSSGDQIRQLPELAAAAAAAARQVSTPETGRPRSPSRVPPLQVDFCGAVGVEECGVPCEAIVTVLSGDRALERELKAGFIAALLDEMRRSGVRMARPAREMMGNDGFVCIN